MKRILLIVAALLTLAQAVYAQAVIVPSPVPACSNGYTLIWNSGASNFVCTAPSAASQPLSDAFGLIADDANPTRVLAFQLSGLSTSTTRTWTIPDANLTIPSTLASLSTNTFTGLQTLNGGLAATTGTFSSTLGVTGVATFTAAPVFSSGTASQTVELNGSKALTTVAITGTGNYVKSASPTLTGTIGGANETLSGTLGVTGVATFTAAPVFSSGTASQTLELDGSKALTTAAITGTGNYVKSGSPTMTGTIAAAAATFSSTVSVTGALSPLGLVDASGASAGQFKFPASQNASADVNTLDDYEEGSWTPVIGGDGGTSGQTYGTQLGRYVKIGRFVTAYAEIDLTAKGTITGNVQVQGLPFTAENIAGLNVAGLVSYFSGFNTTWMSLAAYVLPNGTAAYIVGRQTAGTASAFLVTGDLTNTTGLTVRFEYRATN